MSCSVCAGYSSYNCPCCGESVRMMTCPDCDGEGVVYKAYHIAEHMTVPVTELTWQGLPADEDAAIVSGKKFCRYPVEKCPTCKGEGEIPEDF